CYRDWSSDVCSSDLKKEGIERERHQRNAGPKPAVPHRTSQKLDYRPWPQPRRLTYRLHSVGDGDLAASAAQDQHRKSHDDTNVHQAATSLGTSVVRGLVCPTRRTPTQIRTTPIHRRGETDS